MHQNFVSGRVAQSVIDQFEIVQVYVEEGAGCPLPDHVCGPDQPVIEGVAVQQSGDGIVGGQVG